MTGSTVARLFLRTGAGAGGVAIRGLQERGCLVGIRDGFGIDVVGGASGQDALILVRPDGYIGLIADADNPPAAADCLRSTCLAWPER
jgi:hypothetical protein